MEDEKQKTMTMEEDEKHEKGQGVKRPYSDVYSSPGDFDVQKPDLIAAGDVEDKLKLDGGTSFSSPFATFTQDPRKDPRHLKGLIAAYNCLQKYLKTRRRSIPQEPSSEEKNYEEPKPFGSPHLSLQSTPMKPAIEEDPNPTLTVHISQLLDHAQHEKLANDIFNEGRKKSGDLRSILQSVRAAKKTMGMCLDDEVHSYSHFSYKSLDGHTIEVLARESGDYIKTVYYKGVLHQKPDLIVIAAGGVPEDLKIKDAVSLWYPSPVSKIHKDLLNDPARRAKAMRDAFMEVRGKNAYRKAILEAYEKAYYKEKPSLNPKQSDKQARNRDKPPLSMIEVNLVLPRATGSTSDQVDYLTKWNYF